MDWGRCAIEVFWRDSDRPSRFVLRGSWLRRRAVDHSIRFGVDTYPGNRPGRRGVIARVVEDARRYPEKRRTLPPDLPGALFTEERA